MSEHHQGAGFEVITDVTNPLEGAQSAVVIAAGRCMLGNLVDYYTYAADTEDVHARGVPHIDCVNDLRSYLSAATGVRMNHLKKSLGVETWERLRYGAARLLGISLVHSALGNTLEELLPHLHMGDLVAIDQLTLHACAVMNTSGLMKRIPKRLTQGHAEGIMTLLDTVVDDRGLDRLVTNPLAYASRTVSAGYVETVRTVAARARAELAILRPHVQNHLLNDETTRLC